MDVVTAAAVLAACVVVGLGAIGRRRLTTSRSIVARRSGQRRRRDRAPTAADLIEVLHTAAAEMKSGRSIQAAFLEATAPAQAGGAVWASARGLVASGVPLAEAVSTVARGNPSVDVCCQAFAIAADLGGQPTLALLDAAHLLGERQSMAAERHAQSSQARLSALILTVVPLAFMAWSLGANPAWLGSTVGAATSLAGLGLNAVGWWWMRMLIQVTT